MNDSSPGGSTAIPDAALESAVLGAVAEDGGPAAALRTVDGRSARWAAHREQRRADMMHVARRLIHTQGPDVTMEDIAVASGTSKSIVYRYFTDKAQLQRAIGMHILSGMHHQLVAGIAQLEQEAGGKEEVDAEARIRVMISAYVSTAERSPHVYRFVTRPSDGLNHFLSSTARLVAAALPAGTPSPEVWSAGAVGFVRGAVDRWMSDRARAEASAAGASGGAAAGAESTAEADRAAAADGPAGAAACPGTEGRAPVITDDQLIDHLVTWLMKGLRH
ncbi:TetR/AcrR family transcriptional regulator [Brachybacterium hainanense]|uniref:TetR/AcrR family transcriptional regulator n=1 Tax=Brachybacterium hainanense TaxID=1541174 RepID=A0ABV6RAV7_9MICO